MRNVTTALAIARIALALALALGCRGRERATATPAAPPTAATRTAAPAPDDSPAGLPTLRFGPFTVDSGRYTVEIERYLVRHDTSVKRLRVRDAAGRVVYDEDVATAIARDPDAWIEVSPEVLEDASGRPRALLFSYAVFPSAPNSGESVRLVTPRGGVMKELPPSIDYSGEFGQLPAGSQPRSRRLLEGDRFVVKEWRYHFAALVPYRVDFACTSGVDRCVTVALRDSVAGLSRFRVEAMPQSIDTAVTVELFPTPARVNAERITIGPGATVEVLEGAGHVLAPGPSSGGAHGDITATDWLLVRVNGRTGWVHGPETFTALGLPSAG
jgi:hypothetical protein